MSTEIVNVEKALASLQTMGDTITGNRTRAAKALAYGQSLIEEIKASGMSDELDQKCDKYLKAVSKTAKELNDSRKPYTEVFQIITKEFTAAENALDAKKADTPAFMVQKYRNDFAAEIARKKADEERRRQEAIAKANEEAECRAECRKAASTWFFNHLAEKKKEFLSKFNGVSLDNYDKAYAWFASVTFAFNGDKMVDEFKFRFFNNRLTSLEVSEIEAETIASMMAQLTADYAKEMEAVRADLHLKLPSKKAELERELELERQMLADKANAEEIRLQQAKERAEREAREAEKRRKADEEAEAAKAAAAMNADAQKEGDKMATLFTMAPAPAPARNDKSTLELIVKSPAAYPVLFAHWFNTVGVTMDIADLAKKLDFLITAAKKSANNGKPIESPYIAYEEVVKAGKTK